MRQCGDEVHSWPVAGAWCVWCGVDSSRGRVGDLLLLLLLIPLLHPLPTASSHTLHPSPHTRVQRGCTGMSFRPFLLPCRSPVRTASLPAHTGGG